jgi:ribosomal protein S18 acetylase RimI-like enzyme
MLITQLSSQRWQDYRDLRLLALKSDPLAFASSYDEEAKLDEDKWCSRISTMYFAVDEKTPVAMVGLLRHIPKAMYHCADIVSLWVKPDYRKKSIAEMLIAKLQSLSQQLEIRKLSLEVVVTQNAAIRLYEKMGFEKVALLKANIYKENTYYDEYLMTWQVKS